MIFMFFSLNLCEESLFVDLYVYECTDHFRWEDLSNNV